jgi:hypothetical protein
MAKRIGKYKMTKRDSEVSLRDGGAIDGNFSWNGVDLTPNGVGTTLLGLNPTWNLNFGGATLSAGDVDGLTEKLDVLTPHNTLYKMHLALKGLATQADVPTAAQATQVFGGTGVASSADISLATATTATNIIPATQKIQRLSGDFASTLVLDNSATDLASQKDRALILFTGNTFTASQVLTIGMHTNNEFDAESCEFAVSGDAGEDTIDREAATTDGHQDIILTASGAATTIEAGSFIYFNAGNNSDVMTVKCFLKTSGGTIAITTAN